LEAIVWGILAALLVKDKVISYIFEWSASF
jgi:hypothetical protein